MRLINADLLMDSIKNDPFGGMNYRLYIAEAPNVTIEELKEAANRLGYNLVKNCEADMREEEELPRIRFYIPDGETIPTNLRLKFIDNVSVNYKRIGGGFRFYILLDDEQRAMEIAKEIVQQIKREHDEPQHGVSWVTTSLEVVPQDTRYKFDTIIDWKYRVRDVY